MIDWRELRDAAWYIALIALIAIALLAFWGVANARDLGQWKNSEPAISAWFKNLMQPDAPLIPCCGKADAYWADSYEVKGNQYVAIVTDTRPDEPLGRPHIPVGTKFLIPNTKIKWDKGNPTGHGVLFVGQPGVYCFVPGGGV